MPRNFRLISSEETNTYNILHFLIRGALYMLCAEKIFQQYYFRCICEYCKQCANATQKKSRSNISKNVRAILNSISKAK